MSAEPSPCTAGAANGNGTSEAFDATVAQAEVKSPSSAMESFEAV